MNDLIVTKVDNARALLAEAKSAISVKRVVDLAHAAEIYAKRQRLSEEAIGYAHEVKIDAERLLGGFLKNGPKNKGTVLNGRDTFGNTKKVPPKKDVLTLAQIGITKKESAEAQFLFDLAEESAEVFEWVKQRKWTVAQAKKEFRRKQKQERRVTTSSPSIQELIAGDMRQVSNQIADNSIDLIFTDPPYDAESLPLFGNLSELAARVLKPGGICLTYSGQMFLPQVMRELERHLEYIWTCAILHSGGNQRIFKANLNVGWKPILMYVKPPLDIYWDSFIDITTGGREKDNHQWQQAESEAAYYIERLCPISGIVLDPFAGSGTTLIAAKRLGRHYLGIEVDQNNIEKIKRRLIDD